MADSDVIAWLLIFLLLFKDMSGKDEIRRLREEVKRIADRLDKEATQ